VLGGLIYSFLTVSLRANQNVTGLTLTIFGSGLANFIGGSLNKLAGGVGQISVAATSSAFRATQKLSDGLVAAVMQKAPQSGFMAVLGRVLETIDKLFLSYGFMVYLAVIVAVLVHIFLNRTSKGLNLRAVGENPATADAAGINVIRNKYLATCVGTGITGLGGVYYVMDYVKGTWANDGTIENLGWLAVALVIFATWKPLRSIWGSYLFGIFFWAYLLFASALTRRSQELFRMLPYVVTIIVLIIVSLRKKKEDQPPEALGLAYFREDR
ncbi:MAG: ABC transporter permease, partial [Clostridia bacterium]|nr:ABC transporter permease [Clostridia bacterium]